MAMRREKGTGGYRVEEPPAATLKVYLPEDSLEALAEFAQITGAQGDERWAKLVQDAFSLYEWLVRQQAAGRKILALEQYMVEFLEKSEQVSGKAVALADLIAPGERPRVKAYFQHADS